MTAWTATPRPTGGTFSLPGIRCRRCGRGCYVTMDPRLLTIAMRASGRLRCSGCDEAAPDECWCADTRERA